jgi:hypothetical protein
MKKLLLGITGVSLLLIFTLASCENGTTSTDLSTKTVLQTLAAPTNVKATAFGETGVIRVTWEPVANAAGYHVYRKSVAPKGGETQYVFKKAVVGFTGTPDTYLGIQDVIDFTNEFKPDVTYSYKVVALTDWSSFPAGGAVWKPESDLVLQNSSADSNSVKFDDPTGKNPKNPLTAAGSKLTAPEITLDTVYSYATNGLSENLLVSWDVKPGLSYIVYYSYGSDVLIANTALASNTNFIKPVNPATGQTTYATTFPLINGKTNVQVVAKHGTGYYVDSDPVVENYEGAKTILPSVALTATIAPPGSGVVTLTWPDNPAAESYEVYKFTSNSSGYTGGGYIFDDWTDITDKINIFKNAAGTGWEAYDTDLNDENQGYVYMLISKKGDAKSNPSTSAVQLNNIAAAMPVVTNLDWNYDYKKFQGVQITWNAKLGQTYKLYRKVVNFDIDSGKVIGPKTGTWEEGWTEVTGFSAVPNNDGASYAVIDTPAVKDAYKYKLVTTQGSLTAEKFADLTSDPYVNAVDVTISTANPTSAIPENTSADNTAGWSAKNRGTAYTIGLTLGTDKDKLKALLGAGDTVEIYRAKADGTGAAAELGPYQKVTFDQATFLAQKQVIDTPPEPGYYIYKAVVVSGGNQIRNQAVNTNARATAYTVTSPSVYTDGTAKKFQYNGSTKNEYIQGQELYLRYVDAATYAEASDLFGAGSYTEVKLTYTRTNTVAKENEYLTASLPLPAASATTTRYYELYAKLGNGDLSGTISTGTLAP